MGIASLVLGIVSLVLGWIPFICFIALITAIIGLILGIVDTIAKNKAKDRKMGISMAGLITSAIAIPMIIFMSIVSFVVIIEETPTNRTHDWDRDYYDEYDLDDYFTNRYQNRKKYNTLDYQDYERL